MIEEGLPCYEPDQREDIAAMIAAHLASINECACLLARLLDLLGGGRRGGSRGRVASIVALLAAGRDDLNDVGQLTCKSLSVRQRGTTNQCRH